MITFVKPSWREKQHWHIWFAWHPVPVHTYPDGAKRYVWLKRVLRCENTLFWETSYKYKEIER